MNTPIHFKFLTGTLVLLVTLGMAGCRISGDRPETATGFPAAAITVPAGAWPHDGSDLTPDPQVVYGRFDNGLGYVLMPNRTPRDRVSLHLVVQAGSFHETEDQRGLAHFLEHMLFCGSTHFPPGELVRFFQSIGMRFGPDANARTGFFQTVYDVVLPDGTPASLQQGLLVLQDYAQGALLLPQEIERERGVVLAEMQTRDSAAYRTYTAGLQFAFPEARFAARLPIGVEAVLQAADRAQLLDFYDTWYRPDRMIVVMVGDIEAESARELIAQYFDSLAPRAPPRSEPDFGDIQHTGLKAFYHHEAEMGHTSVSIETVARTEPWRDDQAERQRRLRREIGNRIVTERLQTQLQQPDAPFTAAYIYSGVYLHQVEAARIGARTSSDNWEQTLQALEQHLRQALEYGFSAAEVQRAKQAFRQDLEKDLAGAATRDSQELAGQLIEALNANEVFQSPQELLNLFDPWLKDLTAVEVHQALQEAWQAPHRLIMVTGSTAIAAANPQEYILHRFRQSAAATLTPYRTAAATAFPYLTAPDTLATVQQQQLFDDAGVESVIFANGVQLNLKPTDFKQAQVLVELTLGRGRQSEPSHQPGLAELAHTVINEGGIGRLNRQELRQALAGYSVTLEFQISEDRFVFKGECLNTELETLMQLLYHHLRDPAWRPSAYNLARARLQQQYDNLARSAEGVMTLQGRRFLAGGDTRFGFPDMDDLNRLTLADVRAWMEPVLNQAPLELAVVGDFDPDALRALVGRYLGHLPPRSALEASVTAPLPRFPSGKNVRIQVDTQIPKALVVLAHSGEDFWNIQRTRRISVFADIYANRLRETIRERMGAAYSPFAYHYASRAYAGYGYFQAMVPVHPAQVGDVLTAVQEVAASLRQQPIDAAELQRSLDPILTGIRDRVQTNEYWLTSVLAGMRRHPQQLDWSRTFVSDYTAISVADMHALAERYLNAEAAASLVIMPESF